MHADAIYYLRDKVRFSNPFMEETRADYFFSFVLVVWEPMTRAASAPEWRPLELPRVEARDAAQLLRVRRCVACGKYRVLPRHHRTHLSGRSMARHLGAWRWPMSALRRVKRRAP